MSGRDVGAVARKTACKATATSGNITTKGPGEAASAPAGFMGFGTLKNKMDPRRVNGGTFLGLNGLAVKSHGGTDALGFASAIDIGQDMVESGLVARMSTDLHDFHDRMQSKLAS